MKHEALALIVYVVILGIFTYALIHYNNKTIEVNTIQEQIHNEQIILGK